MEKNPLYLMITVSLSVQFAFMLPVATAPNAVAFTTGKVRVVDLVCDPPLNVRMVSFFEIIQYLLESMITFHLLCYFTD